MSSLEAGLIERITIERPTPMQRSILTLLIRNGWMSRDELIEEIYPNPDMAPDNEYVMLKIHVMRLRHKLCASATITMVSDGYALTGVPGVSGMRDRFPVKKPITRQERLVLTPLLDGQLHSYAALLHQAYGWHNPPSSGRNLVQIFAMRLRRALADGWELQNVWGQGYRLVKPNA